MVLQSDYSFYREAAKFSCGKDGFSVMPVSSSLSVRTNRWLSSVCRAFRLSVRDGAESDLRKAEASQEIWEFLRKRGGRKFGQHAANERDTENGRSFAGV